MIALTKEKREELINRCRKFTSINAQRGFIGVAEEECGLIHQITLAALTASAVGSFHIYEQKVDATTDYVRDGEWPIDEGELLVYAAPPVPEIKLPSTELIKEVFIANGFKEKTQADGSVDLNPYVYDAARALIKRLNGLGE